MTIINTKGYITEDRTFTGHRIDGKNFTHKNYMTLNLKCACYCIERIKLYKNLHVAENESENRSSHVNQPVQHLLVDSGAG